MSISFAKDPYTSYPVKPYFTHQDSDNSPIITSPIHAAFGGEEFLSKYTYDIIYYLYCPLFTNEEPYKVQPKIPVDNKWVTDSEANALTINAWMPNDIYKIPGSPSSAADHVFLPHLHRLTAVYRNFNRWLTSDPSDDKYIFSVSGKDNAASLYLQIVWEEYYPNTGWHVEAQYYPPGETKSYFYKCKIIDDSAINTFTVQNAVVWIDQGVHFSITGTLNGQPFTYENSLCNMIATDGTKCNFKSFASEDAGWMIQAGYNDYILFSYSQHVFHYARDEIKYEKY